ncbi:RHS repeat-associated core domain-containing protein [Agarilytica rhodophyticola]|uniref:RHS repeat-associated core domain-containing protein n=1 Tax=Agarilytica rhodophyticola TaxID=1737490 RepID=UPI000B342D55|nr:RHS repeat-associated core domain-containing protein [Agarilytica rhodophyticola]
MKKNHIGNMSSKTLCFNTPYAKILDRNMLTRRYIYYLRILLEMIFSMDFYSSRLSQLFNTLFTKTSSSHTLTYALCLGCLCLFSGQALATINGPTLRSIESVTLTFSPQVSNRAPLIRHYIRAYHNDTYVTQYNLRRVQRSIDTVLTRDGRWRFDYYHITEFCREYDHGPGTNCIDADEITRIDKHTVTVNATPTTPISVSGPSAHGTTLLPIQWGESERIVHEFVVQYKKTTDIKWQSRHVSPSGRSTSLPVSEGIYQVRVSACNTLSTSRRCSAPRSLSPNVAVARPAVPNITLPSTSGNGSYTVSWNTVNISTRYTLQESVNGATWTSVQDNSARSKAYTNQINASIRYRVRACNAIGCSNFSSAKTINIARKPGVPSSISVPGLYGSGSYTISWGASSDDITYYDLIQTPNRTLYQGLNLRYDISGQGIGEHRHGVRACKTVGSFTNCSDWRLSSIVTLAKPAATPTLSLLASDNDGEFGLRWTAIDNTLRYILQEISPSSSTWTTVESPSEARIQLSGRTSGTYSYRVQACNDLGCSDFSTAKSIEVAISPGIPPSISPPTNANFTIQWGASSGRVSSYQLEQRIGSGAWENIYRGDALTRELNLTQSGEHAFRVRACNTQNAYTSCSAWRSSNAVTISAPNAPSDITVPNEAGDALTITWTATTSNATLFSHYELEEQKDNGAWALIESTQETRLGHVLYEKGDYHYRVRTCQLSLCSPWVVSNTVTVVGAPDAPQAPVLATVPNLSAAEESTGSINSNVDVSAGGAATWSIDLDVPRGIGGFTPSVMLSYSSRGGNGVLGVGWSLSGASEIRRCRRYYEEDGFYREVLFTNQDAVCLNGQRLIPVNNAYFIEGTEYRLQFDPSTRIVYSGGNFEVSKPNGETWWFGTTSDSRMKKGNATYSWKLSQKVDPFNNTIDYSYTGDNSHTRRLSTISYSGNTIEFIYSEREDQSQYFYHGLSIVDNQLLTDIVISNHNNIAVNSYHFDHRLSQVSKRYLLRTMTRCDGAETGACLQPTTFEYEDTSGIGFVSPSEEIIVNLRDFMTVDGDVASDYCDQSFPIPDTHCQSQDLKLMDANGDGVRELLLVSNQGSTYRYQNIVVTPDSYTLGNVSGSGESFRAGFPAGSNGTISAWSVQAVVNDMNGDGHDTVEFMANFPSINTAPSLYADLDGNGIVEFAGGFNSDAENHAENYTNFPGRAKCPENATTTFEVESQAADVFDFNGDGLVDRLYRVNGICENELAQQRGQVGTLYYLLKNTTQGAVHSESAQPLLAANDDDFRLRGDINGDGYMDFRGAGCATGSGFNDCFGDHFGTQVLSSLGLSQLSDVNRDGRDDYIFLDGSTLKVALSYYGFATHVVNLGQVNWTNMSRTPRVMLVDLDGDGLPALVYFDIGKHRVHIRHDANTENKPVDVLRSVNNGLGREHTFKYGTLAYSDHYTPLDNAHTLNWGSPVFDGKGSMAIVEQMTMRTGKLLNNSKPYDFYYTKSYDYHYEGLRYQAGGRGSLGFSTFIKKDNDLKQTTTTYYRQDYPFNGQVKRQTRAVKNRDGTDVIVYERNVNVWEHRQFLSNKAHFIRAKEEEEKHFNINSGNGELIAGQKDLNTIVTERQWSSSPEHYPLLDVVTVTTYNHVSTSNENLVVTTTNTYGDENHNDWFIQRPTVIDTVRTLARSPSDIDSATQKRTLVYHSSGRVKSDERGDITNVSEYSKTATVYDSYGNPTDVTQCSSHYADACATRALPTDTDTDNMRFFRRVTSTFDTEGRYLTATGNGQFTIAAYSDFNALGLPQTHVNATGFTTESFYDAFGRVYFTRAVDGSSAQTIRSRCSNNCPRHAEYFTRVLSPSTPDSIHYFDLTGTEVATRTQTLTGEWSQVLREFDKHGRLIRQSQPYLTTDTPHFAEYSYDDLGRRWKDVAADGTTKTIGRIAGLVSTTVSTSYISSYETPVSNANIFQRTTKIVNGFGQTTSTNDAERKVTYYQYSVFGSLSLATNIDGSTVSITYDDYGRRTRMVDPDKGDITFKPNGLGQEVGRIAPGNVTQKTFFDALGRSVKVETNAPGGNHVGTFDYKGPLLDIETSSEGVSNEGISRTFSYDAWGRSRGIQHRADGHTWNTATTYDQYGRVFQAFDMSQNFRGVQYTYTNGYATQLKESQNSSKVYYEATDMDAYGNVTDWVLGNGHSGHARYDAKTGYLQTVYSGNGIEAVQNNLFEYDGIGNLRTRTDRSGGLAFNELQETFDYDKLFRLKTATLHTTSTPQVLEMSYFDNGNIQSKSDIGNGGIYAYGTQNSQCSITPGAHALTGIGSQLLYCYDARGNQTHSYESGSLTREVNYTGYDKPSLISSGTITTAFFYDANFSRFKRVDTGDGDDRTTYYIGSNEVIHHDSGKIEYKRYIGDMVLNTVDSDNNNETHYFYRDHLGSLVAIADAAGTVLERLSYDAFGQRREGESWNPLFDPFNDMSVQTVMDITTRGFTQHEHVDHANIIHMGGRIYDPVTGRFVQADPIVQAPENGQSLNRYSYVFNNPLSYTDPTGYSAQGTICEQKDLNGGVEDLCTMGGSGDEIQAVNADIPAAPTTEGDAQTEEKATEEANNSTATETDTASEGAFDSDGGGGNEEDESNPDIATADGTYFFGGAGIDGSYIDDMAKSLEESGISDVHAMDKDVWSESTPVDASAGVFALRGGADFSGQIEEKFKNKGDGKGQFNLIGYSYGSLVAAQAAMARVKNGGTVDNLVLIGSPISSGFLRTLRETDSISNIIVKDLTNRGDPINAGMSGGQLIINAPKLAYQMTQGAGHFYYAPSGQSGKERRRELAKELYEGGLR